MHVAAITAFVDEVLEIQKEAGLRDALKKGTKLVSKAGARASEAVMKANAHPIGKHIVNYVQNPSNQTDMAMTLSNVSRFLGH